MVPRKRDPHWAEARLGWLPFLPPLTGGGQAGNPGSPRDWTYCALRYKPLGTAGSYHANPAQPCELVQK